MVDMMLGCDIIETALANSVEEVFVFTDDADAVPALSMAADISSSIRVNLVQSDQTFGKWGGQLRPLGINLLSHNQSSI
jgi:uncharacterized LabA/DUF88 family protein